MKKLRKYFAITSIILAGMLFIASCNKDDDPQPENPIENPQTITEIASGNENFSILVNALEKAELASALDSDGPFTVFAPTNDAFTKLFNSLGVSGIEDISAEALKPILLYHVAGIEAKSSMLSTGYIETLNTASPDELGIKLYVEVSEKVKLNGTSKVSNADIKASNGVIHVIDEVLMPPSIVDLAISNPNFSTLVKAVLKAGLSDALVAEGPYTVFAPTNEAFEALFSQLEVTGIDDLSAEALTPILLYHVVGDNVVSSEVVTGTVPTLNEGNSLDINVSETGVMINTDTKVIAVDVQGTNGVIHAIDKVLLP